MGRGKLVGNIVLILILAASAIAIILAFVTSSHKMELKRSPEQSEQVVVVGKRITGYGTSSSRMNVYTNYYFFNISFEFPEGDGEPCPSTHNYYSLKMPKKRMKSTVNNLFPFVLQTMESRLCCKCSMEELKNVDFMRVCGIGFSFKIDFPAALEFRRGRGEYLREFQFSPLEVEVWI